MGLKTTGIKKKGAGKSVRTEEEENTRKSAYHKMEPFTSMSKPLKMALPVAGSSWTWTLHPPT